MDTPAPLRLTLRFDPGAGVCLWAADAATEAALGDVVWPEQLPLSGNTCAWLHHLVAWFDTSIDWDEPTRPGPLWDAATAQRFAQAAQQALAMLQRELPASRWQVGLQT